MIHVKMVRGLPLRACMRMNDYLVLLDESRSIEERAAGLARVVRERYVQGLSEVDLCIKSAPKSA